MVIKEFEDILSISSMLFRASEEIASSIAFLASPMQSAITGTALGIDGGMHGLRIP